MRFSFAGVVQGLLDALYPFRCPVCDEIVMPKGQLICRGCFEVLSFVRQPVCKKCGKEVFCSTVEYCLDCSRHRRSFEYGVALLNYDERARHSMAGIKYRNKRQYLEFYVEAVCVRFGRQILRMGADALVPVPIHPSRRRKRGFNQAEILAEGIGGKLGIPVCSGLLVRNKRTAPQKELSPLERLKNLEEAFAVGTGVEDMESVIIVDDIYTTGSTVEACTRMLKAAGVKRVYFIAVCIGME